MVTGLPHEIAGMIQAQIGGTGGDTLGSPRSESGQLVITWFAGSWALVCFLCGTAFEFFTSKGRQ